MIEGSRDVGCCPKPRVRTAMARGREERGQTLEPGALAHKRVHIVKEGVRAASREAARNTVWMNPPASPFRVRAGLGECRATRNRCPDGGRQEDSLGSW
jgi:hypothetical protein